VQHADLERKEAVARKKSQPLKENGEARNRKVAVPQKQAVVEQPILFVPLLVHGQGDTDIHADGKGCRDARDRPRVGVVEVGEADRDEDDVGGEEEVADPVEFGELFGGG
jgi:hypothetical protein